ncbi:MAG TPA: LysR family transcriptional regulator [Pelolinea sp.]|nr:LysR family transcriptional regulator [Pelolinea sp.]
MRIDFMKSFCKVVELCSFKLAAESLNLSQPTVSMQVKSLEEEYGVQLLHRESRKILPTEDGQLVYKNFLRIISLYELSRQIIHKNQNNFLGSLLIGASSGPAEYPIPLILGKFKQEHPQVTITLQVGDSIEIIEKVASQSIEMGFVGTKRRDGNLLFEPYLEDNLVLVAAKDHPAAQNSHINFEDLLTIPLILQQPGSGATINLQDALSKVNLKQSDLKIHLELGLQDSVKSAVLAGFGATIISELGVKKELEAGLMRKIEINGLDLMREIYICTNRTIPLSNLAGVFKDYAYKYQKI